MTRATLLTMLSVGAVLTTAGCANMEQKKDLLSAAGFRVKEANTPERRESLNTLPPHQLTRTELNGREVWVYADPEVCNCLYVGTPSEYQEYQNLNTRREIARDRLTAAQMTPYGFGGGLGTGMWGRGRMGWGAWGPWGI